MAWQWQLSTQSAHFSISSYWPTSRCVCNASISEMDRSFTYSLDGVIYHSWVTYLWCSLDRGIA
jgi:hypothetical protein